MTRTYRCCGKGSAGAAPVNSRAADQLLHLPAESGDRRAGWLSLAAAWHLRYRSDPAKARELGRDDGGEEMTAVTLDLQRVAGKPVGDELLDLGGGGIGHDAADLLAQRDGVVDRRPDALEVGAVAVDFLAVLAAPRPPGDAKDDGEQDDSEDDEPLDAGAAAVRSAMAST